MIIVNVFQNIVLRLTIAINALNAEVVTILTQITNVNYYLLTAFRLTLKEYVLNVVLVII